MKLKNERPNHTLDIVIVQKEPCQSSKEQAIVPEVAKDGQII